MVKIFTYKDLKVWQKAMDLTEQIYKLTEKFPKTEVYGITSQMRRSAVSIPSNIAEGRYRSTKKDYLNFLRIAYSSGAELETQIEIIKRLGYSEQSDLKYAVGMLEEVMKMLNVILRKMQT
jgi:four helix bundle protein